MCVSVVWVSCGLEVRGGRLKEELSDGGEASKACPTHSHSHPPPPNTRAHAFTRALQGDWWLEEHGLIMEKPSFPLPAGKYMVTGDREVTTELTVTEDNKWALKQGVRRHLFRTDVVFPPRCCFKACRCRHPARCHAFALSLRPLHAGRRRVAGGRNAGAC